MAFVPLRMIAFGFLAAATAQVGERNVETLREFFRDAAIIKGKTFDSALIARVVSQLQSMVASKIDCKATAESPIGFDLHGVPFAECGDASVVMNLGSKVLNWSIELAIVEGSGGKAVLAWQPTKMELPSGEILRQNTAWKFEFNDQGKINKYAQELDTTSLVTDVGTNNVATARRMFETAKLLGQGKSLSSELMAKLGGTLASSFAPTVDCSMSPAGALGYNLKSVPFQECLDQAQAMLGDVKYMDWDIEAIAAVPASGGTTVLLWQRTALEVAGLPLMTKLVYKLDFNAAGLISAMAQEWDTSAVLETRARAASLASAIGLSSVALPSSFLLGCFVGALPLVALAACRHRLASHEGYLRLAA